MARLTQVEIDRARPRDKKYKLWDEGGSGIYVLVRPSGTKSYYLLYTDPVTRQKRDVKIAEEADGIKEARKRAKVWRGLAARGEDPAEKLKPRSEPQAPEAKNPTIREIRDAYAAYLSPVTGSPPLKSGAKIIYTIDSMRHFPGFFDIRAQELDGTVIQRYIEFAKARGNKEISINDRIRHLSAMWSWAVHAGLLADDAQFPRVKKLQEKDSSRKVRYLTSDERRRLYETLETREKSEGRDYLLTAVIICNYTGIRQGALLKMRWRDITQHPNGAWTLHLNPMSAKSTKDYDLPLSSRVVKALKDWREWSAAKWGPVQPDDYVIRSGRAGLPLTEIKKSWLRVLAQAGIENFRWHDLRHDFASQLVMKEKPLEQVQKLMTHESISMTLRYAHLSPGVLQAAADSLNDL